MPLAARNVLLIGVRENKDAGAELNVALNHLLLLTETDPGEAFRVLRVTPPNGAVLEMGDGTRWGAYVFHLPATGGV